MGTKEIVEEIKIREKERERVLELIRLRTRCRIRGLALDIENQKEKEYFEGAKQELEMFLRHIEDGLKYVEADIDCALKYLSEEEKKKFEDLRTKYVYAKQLNTKELVSIPPNPKGIGYP